MNWAVVVVLLAACGTKDPVEKLPAPAPPSPAPLVAPPSVSCTKALAAPVDPRELATMPPAPARPPRAGISTPTVAGDLEVSVVTQNLRRHQTKFQQCFETQLLANPQLAGGVVETAFAIQPSGQVASPTADGIDPAVAKCISKALASVAFPAPVDGNQVQVSVRIVIIHRPPSGTDPTSAPDVKEWTPFASIVQSDDPATQTIEAVTAAVRARVTSIDQCFDGARGAVRAMIVIDLGRIRSIRVGGIGDSAMERCIGRALGSFTVDTRLLVEIACDIERGGHAPLRISPDAGYDVIELRPTEAQHGASVRTLPPRGSARSVTALGRSSTVLVVADPDAPAHGLDYALWWAPAGPTLVAVKASGGAPVVLGMGDSRAQRIANSSKRVVQLRTDNGRMRACIPGEQLDASAPILDPKQMDLVMSTVAASCQRTACDPTVIVGTSGEFIAKDLVATTSAARRAGFAAISIGGAACD